MDDRPQQFIGADDTAGVEYLLTLWPDGAGEIATRAAGWPGSWGPPVSVQRITDANAPQPGPVNP